MQTSRRSIIWDFKALNAFRGAPFLAKLSEISLKRVKGIWSYILEPCKMLMIVFLVALERKPSHIKRPHLYVEKMKQKKRHTCSHGIEQLLLHVSAKLGLPQFRDLAFCGNRVSTFIPVLYLDLWMYLTTGSLSGNGCVNSTWFWALLCGLLWEAAW